MQEGSAVVQHKNSLFTEGFNQDEVLTAEGETRVLMTANGET